MRRHIPLMGAGALRRYRANPESDGYDPNVWRKPNPKKQASLASTTANVQELSRLRTAISRFSLTGWAIDLGWRFAIPWAMCDRNHLGPNWRSGNESIYECLERFRCGKEIETDIGKHCKWRHLKRDRKCKSTTNACNQEVQISRFPAVWKPKGPSRTKKTLRDSKLPRRSVFTTPPIFTTLRTLLWEEECL